MQGHGSSSVTAVTSNDKFPHIISGNASGSVIIHTFSNSQPLKVLKEPGTDSSQVCMYIYMYLTTTSKHILCIGC